MAKMRRSDKGRRNRSEIVGAGPEVAVWPMPRSEDIPAQKRLNYAARVSAIKMYAGRATYEDIEKTTGVAGTTARYLYERALTIDKKTGKCRGFWICLEQFVIPTEDRVGRKKPVDTKLEAEGLGLRGVLALCFKKYKRIKTVMTEFALSRTIDGGPPVPLITRNSLWRVFMSVCRECGLEQRSEWPFNRNRKGYEAIWRWYKKFIKNHPFEGIRNEFGEEARKLAKRDAQSTPAVWQCGFRLAFGRVEMDEHKCDGQFTLRFPAIDDGPAVVVATTRLWLLVMRDAETLAILACVFAWGESYDTSDLLKLIYRAFCPPPRVSTSFKNPDLAYRPGAAFPGELPGYQLNKWQTLALDAAVPHISTRALTAIETVIGCDMVSERIGDPTARPIIENFFSYLTKEFERFPGATGNQPTSPFRVSPEQLAKCPIDITLANEMLDILCRNANAEVVAALRCTPLERLENMALRHKIYSAKMSREELWRLLPSFECTITRRRGRFGALGVNLYGRYVGT